MDSEKKVDVDALVKQAYAQSSPWVQDLWDAADTNYYERKFTARYVRDTDTDD